MMGDRDFRGIIENALNSIGKELEIDIDSADIQTIHLHEVVHCLRRSYYDRIDPQEVQRKGFNELLSGFSENYNMEATQKNSVLTISN